MADLLDMAVWRMAVLGHGHAMTVLSAWSDLVDDSMEAWISPGGGAEEDRRDGGNPMERLVALWRRRCRHGPGGSRHP